MTPDPYAPYLRQADDLFAQGDITKAGQIWQAIIKRDPSHSEARTGLLAVKKRLLALREAEAAMVPPLSPATSAPEQPGYEPIPQAQEPALVDPRSTPPEPIQIRDAAGAIGDALDPDRLLAEGCTLYDMGQLGDALRKWEQVLALDPNHALARSYASSARRELGLPPLQAAATPALAKVDPLQAEEDIDKLLREAVQLYDMGLIEEAIPKWERVLILEPQRQEVEGYLRQARIELGDTAAPQGTMAVQANATASERESLDLKLRQAEHLLALQRPEEAAFTFQQALRLDPGNALALQGLERCRKPSGHSVPMADPRSVPAQAPVLTLDAKGRIAMAVEETPASFEPQGVEPPAALLKASPAHREGPSLPERLHKAAEHMPWLKEPKVLALAGGGLLVLIVGLSVLHGYRKDQALKDDVRAAHAAAVAPIAQQTQAPDLTESPAAIREEAEASLGTDPLRAFLRAEILVGRNPSDAAGAQLLEKARAGLVGGATGASLPEFQKHLQNGNLEAAAKVIDALLRAQPNDAGLRARDARLQLTLCFDHANQGKWEEAREDLLRGRALFPGDKTWQARLKLLGHVKAMPKNQQATWIALLG
jgi:tetratricopeptide (TPR) repeat protein